MDVQFVHEAYEAHAGQLIRYACALARDSEVAQDIVQETYVRLTREVHAGRTPSNVRAWLYHVARNVYLSNRRRHTVAVRHGRSIDLQSNPVVRSAEEEVLVGEESNELNRMLAGLEPIDRDSLVMAALGYSGAEIARAIGRSENAVRTRLCRARMRLRVQLEAISPASQGLPRGLG